jgi:3-deoxy-D-manno-octulosonic acid kinase
MKPMHRTTIIGNNTLVTAVTNPLNVDLNWFNANYWQQHHAIVAEKKGRASTWFFDYTQGIGVLRHYWRGGLIGKYLADQYLYAGLKRSRPFQEYSLLVELQNRRLNAPVPIAARIQTSGLMYRGDLITQAIDGANSLLELLKTRELSHEEIVRVGQTIARFHQQGVYHADLNINNVLVDGQGDVYLIDFDRGRIIKPSDKRLQGNIKRLHRSFNKEHKREPVFHWQTHHWQGLIDAYSQNFVA